ncbi:MAG: hypothetical protein HUJ25_03500 [Crocinitomicaceae bacterium]|nr:hypothetical protein [Crocinitomicaceae bacterium]
MKKLTFILILMVSITACKKKTTVVIQAEDYMTGSGSAYSGMQYSVVETWTPFFEVKSNTVASGVLDENGAASFELKMKENRKYNLGIETPDNICYSEVTIQEPLTHGENNLVNFDFLQCGQFNINFKNVNCEGPEDEFKFWYYYTADTEIYTYLGYWNNEYSPLTGCQDATVPVYYDRPVGNYTIEWMVERTSGTTTGTDTFTVFGNDSTTYLIEY